MKDAAVIEIVEEAERQVAEARIDLGDGQYIKAESHIIIICAKYEAAVRLAEQEGDDHLSQIDKRLSQEKETAVEKASEQQQKDQEDHPSDKDKAEVLERTVGHNIRPENQHFSG